MALRGVPVTGQPAPGRSERELGPCAQGAQGLAGRKDGSRARRQCRRSACFHPPQAPPEAGMWPTNQRFFRKSVEPVREAGPTLPGSRQTQGRVSFFGAMGRPLHSPLLVHCNPKFHN